MKKALEHLKELYVDGVKKLGKTGELTPAEGEAGYKALEALEIIDRLCKEEEEKEYSQRMGYSQGFSNGPVYYSSSPDYSQNGMSMNGGVSNRPYMMPEMGYMPNGYSERRGRSATTGRYVSRHGDPVEHMIDKLEDMRMEAPDEMTRKAIDRCIDKLETR